MRYLQYFLILFLLADYRLAHIDSLWANDTAAKQFFIYDVATFARTLLLVGQLFIFVICCKIKGYNVPINWSTIFVYVAYWTFALYEFKQWLDFQALYSNG